MKHGSLFSGIGGFDLAAEWMGWKNVFHCEWEEFPRKVLKHHFPKSISYGDITKTDFNIHRGGIDILTGGFPCQPYSQAGKRLGKEDDRHLWPEMLRAIREIQPRWVVGENVRGLINWNGGLVFEEVQTDLENEGYEVQPFLLPACGVNAPHRRDRVWFVAYSKHNRYKTKRGKKEKKNGVPRQCREEMDPRKPNRASLSSITTNPDSKRQKRIREQGSTRGEKQRGKKRLVKLCNPKHKWEKFPTKSPICGGNDGISREMDGITFSKWRNESIKAYGNAIVPQVAHQIFKSIEQYETLK